MDNAFVAYSFATRKPEGGYEEVRRESNDEPMWDISRKGLMSQLDYARKQAGDRELFILTRITIAEGV